MEEEKEGQFVPAQEASVHATNICELFLATGKKKKITEELIRGKLNVFSPILGEKNYRKQMYITFI